MRGWLGCLFALSYLSAAAQVPASVPADIAGKLDAYHLYLDARLGQATHPFAFADFREAVAHVGDSCTLYVAPGVYWVDDPDRPEVVRGVNGREPFGMVIRAKKLHFIGLSSDARQTVLASQRGQMQGAVGNFTMFDFWCDSLTVENLTMGNFCNVDLDYPWSPSLSRPKRSDAITQAHVGYVHGKSLVARNVRFISRLNLNPLNGAERSYYEDCHFECTDDALNGGNTKYQHCTFDLYGQKPFWSTFGRGPLFVDCDFYVKGSNREMYFCKQGGPVTLINCHYHAPSDSIYIGWTAYPQPWLRCYQKNFTLNGKPYTIGSRQPQNTLVMDSVPMRTDQPPYVRLSRHEAEIQVGGKPVSLRADGDGRKIVWRIQPPYNQIACLNQAEGDSVIVNIACEEIEEPVSFPVTAYAVGDSVAGGVAVCQVTVQPSQLPPPTVTNPRIQLQGDRAELLYSLDTKAEHDDSRITWYRDAIPVATSHVQPERIYRLQPSDKGHTLKAVLEPKQKRSDYGAPQTFQVQVKEAPAQQNLDTDFRQFYCDWQPVIAEGFWTVDGFMPADTAEYPWTFDTSKPMWEYGEGFNGAVGKGLLQAQRGARLMYTPVEKSYGDMSLMLNVDPTKTAGQGFGSATGQYMDVCLKFDTKTLTGYGLRIIRTTKHAKAVDFYLVEYDHGQTKAMTDAVSATCYRTGCTISLQARNGRLTAHVETTTPKPDDSALPHVVDLSAPMKPNIFGGIAIQHTGSCGESTTMLHRLQVAWQ